MTFTCSQCGFQEDTPYDYETIVPYGWSWALASEGRREPICQKCVQTNWDLRRDTLRKTGTANSRD